MKIYGNLENVKTDFVNKNKQNKDKASSLGHAESEDKLELSSEAAKLKSLGEKAADISGVRKEKVEGIKLELASNSYKISSEKIAEKIIEEQIIK